MYAHDVARTRGGTTPFLDDELARWLWTLARARLADALGLTLMPDHVHAVLAAQQKRRMAALLGAFSRTHDFGELWEPVQQGTLSSPDEIRRALRYVALNPIRPAAR